MKGLSWLYDRAGTPSTGRSLRPLCSRLASGRAEKEAQVATRTTSRGRKVPVRKTRSPSAGCAKFQGIGQSCALVERKRPKEACLLILQPPPLLAAAADFVDVHQKVGWVCINAICTGSLEFVPL